jgi:lysophospholipase L1-like esterase
MFMGDSITVGTTSVNGRGFRNKVFGAIISRIGNKQLVRPVGASNNGMCGTSGLTVSEVTASPYATEQLSQFKPDVIFLAIGMNDCTQLNSVGSPTLATSRANLTTLLNLIRTTLPSCIVFLTKINDNNTAHTEVVNYNAAITTDTELRSDFSSGLIKWVDDYTDLGLYSATYWADGTHPNMLGFDIMANSRITAFNLVF